MTCQEAELLLGDAECRAAAANASAVAQQDDIMQELRTLQTQLERSQLDKLRAERARDGVAAKLGRMLQAGNATLASSLQSIEAAQMQSPIHSPASNAAFSGYVEAAFAEAAAAAAGEQPPCSKALFGSPPRSPASARGSAAAAAASDAVAAASSPAARSAPSASPRGSVAAASSSPRNTVSNTNNNSSSSQGSRGSLSVRDRRGSGLPGRAAASAPCSPHDIKARGLSIATRVGEQQGKDQ
jgi:hypothetical protein